MTKAEFVLKFLQEGQYAYEAKGLPRENFLVDLILDYDRLVKRENNSLKAKRKAKKEAKK